MEDETRAWLTLSSYVIALGAAFGWRTLRSFRDTGDSPRTEVLPGGYAAPLRCSTRRRCC